MRRSQRERKKPTMFAFDKAHGYHMVNGMMKALLVGACSMRGLSDAQYIHGLMLNEDCTLENILPNCLYSLKASKKKDPDTPNLTDAMAGPHKEEFKEAMRTEVSALEELGTWEVMLRKHLPEGVNVIPYTWAFKIKRYPDGRFRKFKARFCVRGNY